YRVVVNEETGLTKFVSKSDPSWKFETWSEHLLTLFAVGFDPSSNPLRKAPADNSTGVTCPSNVVFHPVQVNGNWLKVRRDGDGSDPKMEQRNRTGYGWVRWRANNKLIIEPFYIS
ncbi:MAG TPA: hypothetical protein VFR12_07795, partial [Pyrinomonadaceae bacterium]|nr:hypothetical protein [Pyrinomonadaceae bacterium]